MFTVYYNRFLGHIQRSEFILSIIKQSLVQVTWSDDQESCYSRLHPQLWWRLHGHLSIHSFCSVAPSLSFTLCPEDAPERREVKPEIAEFLANGILHLSLK